MKNQSLFFSHEKKKIEKNLYSFYMQNEKLKKTILFLHEKKEIEENLFSLFTKCVILIIFYK